MVGKHMLFFTITKIRMNEIAPVSLYLCHSHHPRWPSAAVAEASTSWTQSEADRQQRTEGLAHSPKGQRLTNRQQKVRGLRFASLNGIQLDLVHTE